MTLLQRHTTRHNTAIWSLSTTCYHPNTDAALNMHDWKMTDQTAPLQNDRTALRAVGHDRFHPVLAFFQLCHLVRHFRSNHAPGSRHQHYTWALATNPTLSKLVTQLVNLTGSGLFVYNQQPAKDIAVILTNTERHCPRLDVLVDTHSLTQSINQYSFNESCQTQLK